jgi:hypothetical protein
MSYKHHQIIDTTSQIFCQAVVQPLYKKEPRRKQRNIFAREEKVLRTFLILYWESATPPLSAQELNRPKALPRKRVLGY